MKKPTAHFLNVALGAVSLLCVVIFIVQAVCMNVMGAEAIRQLGVFYMSGITEQASSHFGTIIELRLSQVESIVSSVPPARTAGGSSMQIELTYSARSAGFQYLALYTDDGTFHMIYGTQVMPDVPEDLRRSVRGGKNNVCAGTDAAGTPVVLVGVPAMYPMEDGGTSAALVAGLPTRYLSDTLENNIESSIIEYSIIRNDGSYVLNRNPDITEKNYFDSVAKRYTTYAGKTPEAYASELRAALAADVNYTSEALIDGEHWSIYCTNLPNSEWHLLLKTSNNTLDEMVTLLQRRWSYVSIGGCVLIVLALLAVFVGYYRQTKRQMKALDEARRTAEHAQQAAERSNRAKNEFLSNMSHDIRTPMNGIMGMTSIAIDSLDNPPRVRSCLKKIHVSSRHLLGLITDMLDMSKIESRSMTLNIEPVSLREIMQNIVIVIEPQTQEKSQDFRIYIHDIYHEHVCADRVRLSQILLNVIGNAVKFTPEGGAIQVDLFEEPSPRGEGYIRSHLHIRDNGIGMSKEFQERVFEAFAREDEKRVDKEAGAGMGLAITKYIVDAMNGGIELESEQGKGTHFHIILDLELAAGEEKTLHLPRRNVLVIDSDGQAAQLAVSALESLGLCGDWADSLETAFRMLGGHPARSGTFHLALLDHGLEDRDPLESAEALIGRFGGELPVVLLTGCEWDELEARAGDAGVRGFLPKPLFRSGLYYGLRPLLEEDAPEPEKEEKAEFDLAGRRILVAEDNELNWEIASEILCQYGMEVEWAENGQVCVDKYMTSDVGWYDAILMDLRMPIMTGFEAALAIRALEREDAKRVPIIAVSADAFQDDIQKCLDCGMNAHMAKPMDTMKVLALLRQYMSQA